MKKIALYSPYIPKHSGGGERYLLSIAEVLSWEHDVFLIVPDNLVDQTQKKLRDYEKMFGLHLGKVKVQPTLLGTGKNPVKIAQETTKYDVLFAITDGSIFASFAKKSYLIVQIPWTRRLSPMEHLKLKTWKNVLVYSSFVESVLRRSWGIGKIKVFAPYVDLRDFSPVEVTKKEKIILSTGRFFSHAHSNSKHQDILIESYKKLVDTYHIKGWTLVLAGVVEDTEYLQTLKKMAKGYHVAFVPDLSYEEIKGYNARASIYWHGAGFGVNEEKNPENTEHFGITTLEAMATGAIPFVVPKGGQKEIVANEKLFWDTEDELVQKTASFIKSMKDDPKSWQNFSQTMICKVENYTKANFEKIAGDLV